MSYTVMGDGVNIAARLEGANKELGTRICVSKAVVREAGERLILRRLDEITVKGRKSAIEVYELLGLQSEP
jgi:adenylate cyclase